MTYTVELHINMTPKKDKNLFVCVVCRGHKDGMTYTVDLHINPVKKRREKTKTYLYVLYADVTKMA